jgi:hypothetical protein
MNTINLRKLMAVREETKIEPPKPSLATDVNSKFVYSNGSDVMKTFKRYGFVPPSEVRNDYLFKKNREMKDE